MIHLNFNVLIFTYIKQQIFERLDICWDCCRDLNTMRTIIKNFFFSLKAKRNYDCESFNAIRRKKRRKTMQIEWVIGKTSFDSYCSAATDQTTNNSRLSSYQTIHSINDPLCLPINSYFKPIVIFSFGIGWLPSSQYRYCWA